MTPIAPPAAHGPRRVGPQHAGRQRPARRTRQRRPEGPTLRRPAAALAGPARDATRPTRICPSSAKNGYQTTGRRNDGRNSKLARRRAAPRRRGMVVAEKARRIMPGRELQPKAQAPPGRDHRQRPPTATTDSDHGGPPFPNPAAGSEGLGPDRLRVADITLIAPGTGLACPAPATVLGPMAGEARSWTPGRGGRSGHALDARLVARLVAAAPRAAVAHRRPPPGCVPHEPTGGSTRPVRTGAFRGATASRAR